MPDGWTTFTFFVKVGILAAGAGVLILLAAMEGQSYFDLNQLACSDPLG
jgi:hypothetical protein